MYYPDKKTFKELSKQGLMVPVYRELDGTIGNPFEVFERLNPGKNSFLLESARFHPKTGRYSFIGFDPFMVFKSKGECIEVIRKDGIKRFDGNPILELRRIFNGLRSIKLDGMPNFTGGAVGYFGYDIRHFFEKLPRRAKDDLKLHDINLLFVDTVIAFDHLRGSIKVISNAQSLKDTDKSYPKKDRPSPFHIREGSYDEAVDKIERLISRLNRNANDKTGSVIASPPMLHRRAWQSNLTNIKSNFTEEEFRKIVKKAKEYIASGDIFQANLSQRFAITCDIDPLILYKALRGINPSPFAAYLDLGDLQVVSSSPERLLELEGRNVQTRPIAGTRPRGKTPEEDRRLSHELILNEKERAEHIMLVDLERNDLGRVCEYGTVLVDELMVIEEYSHVFHIVSNVKGMISEGMDRFDLLRAAFPGGTITGCPKVRCMEIIDELEPVTRNIYTGSIGYLGFNGDMDLNIVIRTLILTKGIGYLQVGAGIVADSDPAREYCETLYKAEAIFKALGK